MKHEAAPAAGNCPMFLKVLLVGREVEIHMATEKTAGHSGTPLSKKLGIKEGSCLLILGAPDGYRQLLEPLPPGVLFESKADPSVDIVHLFVTQEGDLVYHLTMLREELKPEATLWVSWPKKAAKFPTTITEDTIREWALPLGFVDIKVCAVSEVWSGLKLVVRKELRISE